MPATYGVQKSSAPAVISWYERQDDIKFAIYRGIKESDAMMCGGYYGNDKEGGIIYLDQFLSEIEPNDYNIYFLKLLPTKSTSKVATPGVTFQLYQHQSSYAGIAGYNSGNTQVMNEVLNEIRALRAERLAELQGDAEEEEETEAEEENDILAGFLKSPQMQNMLMGALTSMLMPKAGQPVQAMGAIENDEEALKAAVNELLSKGATVADLQKLAAMDKGQINMLLSMLRK